MAETIAEFYAEHWVELQTQPVLNGLQPQVDDLQTLLTDLESPSKVAEHRLWNFTFSVFAWMQKQRFGQHAVEMEAIAAQNGYGTEQWWVEVMKTYQHGYSLDFINNRPAYGVYYEPARIVKRAAAISLGGGYVQLKAAGDGVALDAAQAAGLTAFCRMVQPAGPTLQVIALNADKLRLAANVYVNSLVIAPDGQLIASPGVYPIEDAINAYLATIPFNGVISLTALKDAVQKVEGVNDFVMSNATALQGLNSFPISRLFQTVSGWVLEYDTVGQTFRDLFTYTSGS